MLSVGTFSKEKKITAKDLRSNEYTTKIRQNRLNYLHHNCMWHCQTLHLTGFILFSLLVTLSYKQMRTIIYSWEYYHNHSYTSTLYIFPTEITLVKGMTRAMSVISPMILE